MIFDSVFRKLENDLEEVDTELESKIKESIKADTIREQLLKELEKIK